MNQLLAVGIGGFIGACARYGITNILSQWSKFPFATLISNVIAGLLIGIIIGFERQNGNISPNLKLFLTTGFLGGLSTFSTFSLETVAYIETAEYIKATANTLLNVGLCLFAVFIGFGIAKLSKLN